MKKENKLFFYIYLILFIITAGYLIYCVLNERTTEMYGSIFFILVFGLGIIKTLPLKKKK